MFGSKDLLFSSEKYGVAKSLRFRSGSTTYFNRTQGTPTNNKKWTWSGWVKRGSLANGQFTLFSAGSGNDRDQFQFGDEGGGFNDFQFYIRNSTGALGRYTTAAVYRDPSAWYHVVLVYDSANATAANRVLLYVNGGSVTLTANTTLGIDTNSFTNQSGIVGYIGSQITTAGQYFDGYLAEVNFIDGQALTPSSFGAYDTNGVWQPAAYTGSYGTNGFYLKFTDVGATSGSNTGYGKDFAGTNYWTTNNFGTTSTATTYDSMLDSPTNAAGDVGNYAVLNPLNSDTNVSLSQANLQITTTTGSYQATTGTMGVSSGKWYWEVNVSTNGLGCIIGIANLAFGKASQYVGQTAGSYGYYGSNGNKYNNGSGTTYGATYGNGNVIGVALDLDGGTLTFYKDNVSQGTAYSSLAGTFVPAIANDLTLAITAFANFGQRPFTYTPPSGYSALNTQNLTTPTITNGAQYMAAVTYTGTGSTQTITASSTNSGNNPNGTTFQPDLVWVKSRSGTTDHALYDAVRGVQLQLESNTTTAETTETTGLTAFTSSGFTTGALAQMNTNTATYVAWEWKAGGTGVSNTSGSITSTVSANTSAGFSVVTYTGTGATGTVGHGLGVAPSMVIVKCRNSAGSDWLTWHTSIAATEYLLLNGTGAKATATSVWNSTAPTSSVFSVGTNADTNGSTRTFVAYCFAPVAGYSAFGSYTGNGSADGPFVYLGFRPRYIMIKRTDATQNWPIIDTSRDTYNVANKRLFANLSDAEDTGIPNFIDILSNGFKCRDSNISYNASGGTYIYACFAENPFKIARAR
jgi:hypothetical protein